MRACHTHRYEDMIDHRSYAHNLSNKIRIKITNQANKREPIPTTSYCFSVDGLG